MLDIFYFSCVLENQTYPNAYHFDTICSWNEFKWLKVHGLFFSKLVFCFIWRIITPEISTEMVKPFGCMKQFCMLQFSMSYCVSLFMITVTRHVFIDFFQTKHFAAVEFATNDQENKIFLVTPGVDWELRAAVANLTKSASFFFFFFLLFPRAILKATGPRMTPKQAAHVVNTTTPLWPVRPCVTPKSPWVWKKF